MYETAARFSTAIGHTVLKHDVIHKKKKVHNLLQGCQKKTATPKATCREYF